MLCMVGLFVLHDRWLRELYVTISATTVAVSTGPGELRLTRGTGFVMHYLNAVAVTGLRWFECRIWGASHRICYGFCFVSSAHGLRTWITRPSLFGISYIVPRFGPGPYMCIVRLPAYRPVCLSMCLYVGMSALLSFRCFPIVLSDFTS